jgi:uncharacterized protein
VKPVLLDTGAIVALLDRSEQHHAAALKAVNEVTVPLVTCEAVIAESCYLLRKLKGAPEAVLENVAAGVFQIPLPLSACAKEVQRILTKYRRRETDLADACLIQLAENFGTGDILTLDRDFHVYRWGGNRAFQILIPLS